MDWLRDWSAEQCARMAALAGRTVVDYRGIEMAVVESGPKSRPVFAATDADFVQLLGLHVAFDDGRHAAVRTTQHEFTWSLSLADDDDARAVEAVETGGIYRRAALANLPRGRIERVRTVTDPQGLILALVLTVGGVDVALGAGEAHERLEEPPAVKMPDESVLVFRSVAALQRHLPDPGAAAS